MKIFLSLVVAIVVFCGISFPVMRAKDAELHRQVDAQLVKCEPLPEWDRVPCENKVRDSYYELSNKVDTKGTLLPIGGAAILAGTGLYLLLRRRSARADPSGPSPSTS